MRSTASLGRLAISICAVSLAVAAADDGGSIARDIGEGAGTAAGNVASGVRSAGQGVADAGAAAAGAVSGAASTAAEAARKAATERLSDAQIAAVAVAANKVEIDAAQAARKKAKNAQVKRFASDMIRDHTAADQQATALVKRLGLTPEGNETSRSLAQRAEGDLANLQPLEGKDFEKAYAEHELAFHRQVLATFDERLISDAQNADLKSLLESLRSVVAEHRDHAQALVDSLSK